MKRAQGDSTETLVRNFTEWADLLARHQDIFTIGAQAFMTDAQRARCREALQRLHAHAAAYVAILDGLEG